MTIKFGPAGLGPVANAEKVLGQYKKLVEGMADKTIDYNVNINVLNDQLNIIRDVIKKFKIKFSEYLENKYTCHKDIYWLWKQFLVIKE